MNERGMQKTRSPWRALLPLGTVVVLAALWSAYWFSASAGARAAFERWQAQEAGSGRALQCDELEHGGYPFRFETRCTGLSYTVDTSSGSHVLSASELRVVSMAYTPNRFIAELDGPLLIERQDGGVVEMGWELARASFRVDPAAGGRAKLTQFDGEIDAPLMNIIAQPGRTVFAYRAQKSEFHLREDVRPENPEGHQFAYTTIMPTITLLDRTTRSAERFDTIGAVSQTQGLPVDDLTTFLDAWRSRGGILDVEQLRLALGEALATLDGRVRLDGVGRPEGIVNVTTAGLDVSQIAGDDAIGLSGIAAISIGALGTPVELEGRQGSRIAFRLDDGTLFLGPFGIAQVPSLLRR